MVLLLPVKVRLCLPLPIIHTSYVASLYHYFIVHKYGHLIHVNQLKLQAEKGNNRDTFMVVVMTGKIV